MNLFNDLSIQRVLGEQGNGDENRHEEEVPEERRIKDLFRDEDDGAPENVSVLKLSENAMTVLKRRYLKKDENGNVVETPEQMFRRIASFIASADQNYDKDADIEAVANTFYSMMANCEFIPNSPTLMNAGRELGQLSACFVLPVDDSMESIFETVKNTALIHKSGGGTGFSFSRIRPNTDIVQSTKGVSSGPISFMTVFDAATEAIKQGGTRRGANMAVLRVDHPDIMSFITCKQDNFRLNNFNISVGLTEQFMTALSRDEEYELINPRNNQPNGKLKARDVFDKIVEMAWRNGDPGIVFLDRINADNPTPEVGEIESTNPCGEQPLLPYESCNLGSINLSKFVANGKLRYDQLRQTVRNAIHFLDNVIDKNKFPLPQIEEMTRGNRKIGLGIMGFADLLIKMGIPYNSERALEIAEQVMQFISEAADEMSTELAQQRGVFPNFERSIYREHGPGFRNATRTTIAPTGTISIIAGCSSGIEPLFALSYWRNVMDNDKLQELQPLFKQTAETMGFYNEDLMDAVLEKGGIQQIDEIPDEIKKVFVTAHEISPEWHIRMQAAFQKYTDNAVSKTVNFPNQTTVDDVRHVFELAYQLKCKGVTIYRDGSREVQVLNRGKAELPAETRTVVAQPKRKRPDVLTGKTIRITTGCGSMYVTINEDLNGPFELFSTIGKAGGCAASQSEAIGRLISLAWRSGIKPEEIEKELIGINCHKPTGLGRTRVTSCPDAMAKAIKKYLNSPELTNDLISYSGACPECGGQVEPESGCAVCRNCGFSECG
ncbi:MAG TPA: vitamin B12-dependent ribonucleotide reductase [bacterium]|nr:vitamin B12-dependent ribonucleotide reductase [bacterium]